MISERVQSISESVTLKLNSLAVKLAAEGKEIFNLTAGQLPFAPTERLTKEIANSLSELKSFQYSPVPGFPELRKKIVEATANKRGVDLNNFDCVISSGAKHSLTNALLTIIDPGDEVMVLAPYWISYPEMIKLAQGKMVEVAATQDNGFVPDLDEIKKKLNKKTKAIILNSPNNPSGIFYNDQWIEQLATMLLEYPEVVIISDEIYYDLSYEKKYPRYLYQARKELLERTIIIDGISKNLACTGLRIGYLIADKKITTAVSNLQGHTASGTNSLVQKALINFDFGEIPQYLGPINEHLASNSKRLKEILSKYKLESLWYGPNSAFYFMVDLTKTKYFQNFSSKGDHSLEICQKLIEEKGVVCVPGSDFGVPNSLRLSLVLEPERLTQALTHLFDFLTS